jgi:8-amino-7-oxononanoate synthase
MHNGFRSMGFDTGVSVTPVVPVLVGDQVKCFRFWKALFEAGVFTNPVIPPAVEPGHALLRTSYMATHTDAQLDRVLEAFEKIGRRMSIIPETRPTTYVQVKVARPGTFVTANQASQRWAAASAGLLAERGLSLEAISKLSGRDVARKLADAVETLTWRAANLQPEDLKRLGSAPLRLWEKRTEIPGLILEKGANLFMKNGKQPDA